MNVQKALRLLTVQCATTCGNSPTSSLPDIFNSPPPSADRSAPSEHVRRPETTQNRHCSCPRSPMHMHGTTNWRRTAIIHQRKHISATHPFLGIPSSPNACCGGSSSGMQMQHLPSPGRAMSADQLRPARATEKRFQNPARFPSSVDDRWQFINLYDWAFIKDGRGSNENEFEYLGYLFF